MALRTLFLCLFFSCFSFIANAAECLDVFPGPTIDTEYGEQLILPPFDSSNSVDDRTVADEGSLSLSAGEYRTVTVGEEGELKLTETDGLYLFQTLNIGENATLEMAPGDYFIDTFELQKDTTLTVTDGGTVRIYTNDLTFERNLRINEGADSDHFLIIVSYDDMSIDKDIRITGVLYAVDNIDIQNDTHLTGAITAENVSLGNTDEENYDASIVSGADFNGMCGAGSLPVVEFSCDSTFVNAITSVNDIEASGSPVIINDINGILMAREFNEKSTNFENDSLLCQDYGELHNGNGYCDFTGSGTDPLSDVTFIEKSGGSDFEISSTVTLGAGGENVLGDIDINDGGVVSFDESSSVYYINSINMLKGGGNNNGTATLNLKAGDYYIKKFEAEENSIIHVVGGGIVRLYLQDESKFKDNSKVNENNLYEQLLIYGTNKVKIENNASVAGFVYSKNEVEINGSSALFGAASAENKLIIKDTSEVTYACNYDGNEDNALELNFEFNEGSGQDVLDSSEFNRHGVLGLSDDDEDKDPAWQCEANGHYLSFDASDDDRVSVDEFTPPTEVSIAFWMKVPSIASSTERIFGMGGGWEARWAEADDGNMYVYFDINYDDNQPSNDNAIRTAKAFTNADAGQWIHFAFTGSMDSGEWIVYLNGVQNNTGNVNFTVQSDGDLDDLWLGGRSGQDSEFFNGDLENFSLYSRVLSESDVATLAASEPEECSANIAYYSFEQESFVDDEILDFSGNNRHGKNVDGESVSEGKYCRGFDTSQDNNGNNTKYAFDTNLNLNDDIGNIGTISFWYNHHEEWGDENRTLFDASSLDDDKYFYLRMSENNRLTFKFENDYSGENGNDDFTVEEPSFSPNREKDTWYYLTVTWDLGNDIFQIYVDGESVIEETELSTGGSLGTLGNLIIGDNSSTYSGGGPSRNAFGYFDEVRIYKEVRTQAEIQTDMNDSSCEADVLELHFDFNEGSGQTSADLSGNNRDATLGANTGEDANDPTWQCEADGFVLGFASENNQYATTSSFEPPADGTIAFWMKIPSFPQTLYQQRIFGFGNNWEARIKSNGRIYWDINSTSTSVLTELLDLNAMRTNSAISGEELNEWIHFAFTTNTTDGTWAVYKNGVLDNSGNETLEEQPDNIFTLGSTAYFEFSPTFLGTPDSNLLTNTYNGSLEDFRIYSTILSADDIAELAENSPEDCGGVIDHYQIHHNTSGLTCAEQSVTVKACTNAFDSDASCSESDEAVTLDLELLGPTENVTKTLVFTNTQDVNLNYTAAEIATFSIKNASPTATEDYRCVQAGTTTETSCEIQYSDAGFIFTANNSTILPTQLAGKPSNVGYNSKTWQIKAVEKNSNTGACQAALAGEETIEIGAKCIAPNTCAGGIIAITGIETKDVSPNDQSDSLSYTEVKLDFGDEEQTTADIIVNYSDAGQMQLFARYAIPPDPGAIDPITEYMEGESGIYLVKPYAFTITVTNPDDDEELNADNANSTTIIAAGKEFDVSIKAVQWAADQDAGPDNKNDGIYNQNISGDDDSYDDISDNAITPNFNHDRVLLTHELIAPESGLSGTLTTTGSSYVVENGLLNQTAKFSEVGIIKLQAKADGPYLGDNSIIQGINPTVGRFTPAYFTQEIESEGDIIAKQSATGTCSLTDWVYAGQMQASDPSVSESNLGAIVYNDDMEPVMRIFAYNQDHQLTENYTLGSDEGYMKLTAANVFDGMNIPDSDAEQLQKHEVGEIDVPKVELTANMFVGDLSPSQDDGDNVIQGPMLYTFNADDNFFYHHVHESLLVAYGAKLPFALNTESDVLSDSDGVSLYPAEDEFVEDITEDIVTEGLTVNFGRWFVENSFGPETSDLRVPMYTQIYNGNDFVINPLDNCTAPALGTKVESGDLYDTLTLWDYRLLDIADGFALTPDDTQPQDLPESTSFIMGEYDDLFFDAPVGGKQGSLNFEYAVPQWLQYDWENADAANDGPYENNPIGIITFGRYRGNDRIISWREVSN